MSTGIVSYEDALRRAEAAMGIADNAEVFAGCLREAISLGYDPSHLPSRWQSLLSKAGISVSDLISSIAMDPSSIARENFRTYPPKQPYGGGRPIIGTPPYTPMTQYQGKPLTSEVYHDFLLRVTFRRMDNFRVGHDISKKLAQLQEINVALHNYSSASANQLRHFWPQVRTSILSHATNLVGADFVENCRIKYEDNPYS